MPHVSHHKLSTKESARIQSHLLDNFQKAFTSRNSNSFTGEFFTKTERTMFAKRLAIIAMLNKKVPPFHISQALKVSPSTVARLSLKIESGKLNTTLKILNKEDVPVVELIEKILLAGLPPRAGKGRWKSVYTKT